MEFQWDYDEIISCNGDTLEIQWGYTVYNHQMAIKGEAAQQKWGIGMMWGHLVATLWLCQNSYGK